MMTKMTPVKIIIIFLVSSQLWIFLTDILVAKIATSPEMFTRLSIMKGGLYVAVAGLLLYWLIRRYAAERSRAEEARAQSDSQFRALFDHAPLGIVVVGPDRRILNCNRAFQNMLGYSLEELRNLSVPEISHAGDDRATRGNYQAMMAGELDSYTVEKRYIRKNGTTMWGRLTGTILRGDKSSQQCIFGIVEDITEHKRAEDALHESERRYKAMVENQAEFVTRYVRGGELTFVNDTLCKYLALRREDLLGKSYYPFIHQDDRDSLVRQVEALDIHHPSVVTEGRVLLPDGRVTWQIWTHKAIFDDDGSIIEYQGTGRDITSTKRAEEALRASEARFRSIIENANTGISVADIETRQIRYANPEFCRILGYRQEELCSLLAGDLAVAVEQSEAVAAFQDHAEGNVHATERTFRRKDGSPVRVSIRSVRMDIDDRPCLVGFFSDITEKNLLEEERLKTQKLEAIGTLAGGIAHDFNNLLQGVFGYISLAKLRSKDREKSLAALEEAEKALHMSVKLTNQLLTFSKGGKPVKKVIDLLPVVENAAKFALSGSRTGYRISADENLRRADADEGQIGQVIQNIVLNADQAMPEGGQVEITARNVVAPGSGLPAALPKGNYVEIAVKDSGVGIPEQYLVKIFDPYFTTKEKGSGLGLTTSYSIMKNHNGLIDVRSEQGKGTVFSLYIPAAASGAGIREKPAPVSVSSRSGKVLVMDDEPLIRDVAGALIAELGHRVEFALHGREAIEKFQSARRSGDPFDVVILDLTIRGGMGGSETLRRLLEIDPGVKAVVSSGYSEDAVASRYHEQGFKAFLKKPYAAEDLQEVLAPLMKA